ncbi:hypothetical protein [Sphingobacterium siyangense]|jgi:hypothetical protein|uniref:hypothetical protein n=1 Tax=Sphingobacterium siyangense TaxID=459529 RepID=UPI003DA32FC2
MITKDEILNLVNTLYGAIKNNDVEILDSLLHDDLAKKHYDTDGTYKKIAESPSIKILNYKIPSISLDGTLDSL